MCGKVVKVGELEIELVEEATRRGIVDWDAVMRWMDEQLENEGVLLERDISKHVEQTYNKTLYWSERDRVVKRFLASRPDVKRVYGRVRGRLVRVLVKVKAESKTESKKK